MGLVVLEGHPCLSALVDRIDGSANKTVRVWIHLGAVAADFPIRVGISRLAGHEYALLGTELSSLRICVRPRLLEISARVARRRVFLLLGEKLKLGLLIREPLVHGFFAAG